MAKVPTCHPERKHAAKGICKSCYYNDRYRNDPVYRARYLAFKKANRDKLGREIFLTLTEEHWSKFSGFCECMEYLEKHNE